MKRRNLSEMFGQSLRRLTHRSAPLLEPFEAYQLWAESYDDIDDNALLAAESSIVLPLIAKHTLVGKVLLDAACGTGRYLQALSKANPRLLTAIDFAPNMIRRVNEKMNGATNLSLQVADLERLPFRAERFDFILCTLAIDHVSNVGSVVTELSRVLKRGGRIIISSFHPFGGLLGWQRTFRSGHISGQSHSFAVRYYPHSHSDYRCAFQRSHLDVIRMHEPTVTENLRPMYERAERLDLYERTLGFPLVLIFELAKQ
jgi:malonyl-CoA O-methyltransferase